MVRAKTHAVAFRYSAGHVDTLEVEPSGLVRALGWSMSGDDLPAELLVNGKLTAAIARYKTYRPDLTGSLGPAHTFHGVGVEWLMRPQYGEVTTLALQVEGKTALRLTPRLCIEVPAYDSLFTTATVLGRGDIYCSGPPVDDVAEDVLALAAGLPGPLLDFGCGKGALIKRLRARGMDARGIEIDRPEIREALDDDTRPLIQLYDGQLPAPFVDRSFASVTCIEVLEHCAQPAAVVAELARLTRERCVVTVPDMSAIPLCYRHHVVPWHLLEATHVNFFTHASLESLLRKRFREVTLARIGSDTVNGARFWTSLAAVCVP